MTATNIVTDSPLLITGSINASGLVFIDSYYDNPSTIKGSINARGIFINDIIAPVVASSTNSEFMVRASDKNDTENVKKALMIINPGSDSNLLIVFYVQIMPDDLVMQLHRF